MSIFLRRLLKCDCPVFHFLFGRKSVLDKCRASVNGTPLHLKENQEGEKHLPCILSIGIACHTKQSKIWKT
jgi:hypothetical protein